MTLDFELSGWGPSLACSFYNNTISLLSFTCTNQAAVFSLRDSLIHLYSLPRTLRFVLWKRNKPMRRPREQPHHPLPTRHLPPANLEVGISLSRRKLSNEASLASSSETKCSYIMSHDSGNSTHREQITPKSGRTSWPSTSYPPTNNPPSHKKNGRR